MKKKKDNEINIDISWFRAFVIILLVFILIIVSMQKIDIDIPRPFWSQPIVINPQCQCDVTCRVEVINKTIIETKPFNWVFPDDWSNDWETYYINLSNQRDGHCPTCWNQK